jgi:hypothetical protein
MAAILPPNEYSQPPAMNLSRCLSAQLVVALFGVPLVAYLPNLPARLALAFLLTVALGWLVRASIKAVEHERAKTARSTIAAIREALDDPQPHQEALAPFAFARDSTRQTTPTLRRRG